MKFRHLFYSFLLNKEDNWWNNELKHTDAIQFLFSLHYFVPGPVQYVAQVERRTWLFCETADGNTKQNKTNTYYDLPSTGSAWTDQTIAITITCVHMKLWRVCSIENISPSAVHCLMQPVISPKELVSTAVDKMASSCSSYQYISYICTHDQIQGRNGWHLWI